MVEHALLRSYRGRDWLTWQRARTVLYIDLAILAAVVLDTVSGLWYFRGVPPNLVADVFFLAVLLVALALLVTGRLGASLIANFVLTVAGLALARIVSTGRYSLDPAYDVAQAGLNLCLVVSLGALLGQRAAHLVALLVASVVLMASYVYALPRVFGLTLSPAAGSVVVSTYTYIIVAGLIAVFTFLTNQRALREAQREADANRENERMLRVMFDAANHLIGVLTVDGTLLRANRTSLEFARVDAAGVIGRPFWDCAWWTHDPDMQARLKDAVARAATGEAVRFETTHRRGDGEMRVIDFSLTPVLGDDGRPALLIPEGRDITERFRNEERRRGLEARLLQAQKMEAIGTLAGGIAHDFNNVLHAIVGHTELARFALARSGDPRAHLDRVLEGADRARQLVQQILAFSRKQELVRRPVDVGALLGGVLQLLRASLPPSVEIRKTVPDTPVVVEADATQLHQVLVNVCTNAAQAMPDGGVLEITLTPVDDRAHVPVAPDGLAPGPLVWLSVRDTGVGMAPEIVDRIFEPFFTTKPAGQGTGLGLSLVHGIVTGYGGALTVDTAPGRGTTMHIVLPRADAMPAPSRSEDAPLARGAGQHILFVDDEPHLVANAVAILTELGYRVTAFDDPEAAVAAFTDDPDRFDAILSDLRMPGMSGTSLVRAAIATRPSIPVALMTGYPDPKEEAAIRQLGVEDVILKPFAVRDLAALLARLVSAAGPTPGRD